ncbi:MAG: hypothetical protein OEV36_01860 [Myxococcales bacterium]|nr:hypothetical protein [Myxococcales bacterium]
MSNIALNYTGQSGDLDLTGHRLHIVRDEAAIEQNLRVRLLFFLGEWFLDRSQGIPYYRDVYVKAPNLLLLRHLFRTAILSTTGISLVESLDITLDKQSRKMNLSFRAVMDTGAVLTYNPFVIEI